MLEAVSALQAVLALGHNFLESGPRRAVLAKAAARSGYRAANWRSVILLGLAPASTCRTSRPSCRHRLQLLEAGCYPLWWQHVLAQDGC